MDKSDIIESLNDLIQITEDSHDGYRRSAEDAKDSDIQSLFRDLSTQRESMVRELQDLVAQLGGQPTDSGTMLAGAHRFFVDLKSAVTGQDREAILREVERGESEAIRRHENVLSQPLPADIAAIVRRHLDRFQADRNRMTALKRAA
ncbi:MAG TPA: PA2169 family four-helix-bundle protein [Azospirillaceae bacterium]|nr:PA2169 family four-helix-bundle protein [Azospirillaceae bacterium]